MDCTVEELFSGYDRTIIGDLSAKVTGLSFSSLDTHPGDAFFCIVGENVDGHTYAQDAMDKGAAVIVSERPLYLADSSDVTVVVVSDTRAAMAYAADVFFDHPTSKMALVGITGTNGKTTITYLVDAIANHCGHTSGIIGTVGVTIDGAFEKTERTTPESAELQELMWLMVEAGCDIVSLEVSSHALDLLRVFGCKFEVSAFTNLTHDHLDYHHTFQDYFEAKARLFSSEYPSKRVINIDNDWGRELLDRARLAGDNVLTYGFSEDADIRTLDMDLFADHTEIKLSIKGGVHSLSMPLVGRFNVENAMCAIGIALKLGLPLEGILEALEQRIVIPGRLEHVLREGGSDIYAIVDYAHTPDALQKSLDVVRETATGNVILIFGCEGDRDKEKRPQMGKISLGADVSIVSSDNVRGEDRVAIIEDVMRGMADGLRFEEADGAKAIWESASRGESPYVAIPDRRRAIAFAAQIANPGDTILIAGKGHEDYEVIGTTKYHLDDREEALRALDARAEARTSAL